MGLRRLIVRPDLPEALEGLHRLAMNMWFTWNPDAGRLFQGLDEDLWESTGQNPILLLAQLSGERLDDIVNDPVLMKRINGLVRDFDNYVSKREVYSFGLERPIDYRIAYFSMEYGLGECLPIYSGGLGVLAGDHLKSASNLCFPLTGIGLLYQKGYFQQYLNIDGWQMESYPDNDFYNMPLAPVLDAANNQAYLELDFPDGKVKVLIWSVHVGRVTLYLLDTNHPDNAEHHRRITAELYGGDTETRIRQEIVLGIGGARALHLLGLWPFVYHLNEGHAAFAALERIRQTMATYRVSFDVAMEAVAASTVFTTHTPVPAGIDLFSPQLIERYLGRYVESLGLSVDDLLHLGRENPSDSASPLSMAVLALRLSSGANGVSRLHCTVSRRMWRGLWPDMLEKDVPIGYVTNGVHIPSYLSKEMGDLFARYLGEGWIEDPDNEKIWSRVYNIPPEELWRVHETRRERLVSFARRRMLAQMQFSGGAAIDVRRAGEYLNPEALTIGFARRFAQYKRAGLIFSDPDRLLRIVSDKLRPVQFIFAGKAHPRDHHGKELIKEVVHQSRTEGFRRRLVFLEDYDINMARYLVQGVDVWLNNPRRPREACGTSGMKAAANGALNLSILDGWWPEAYDGTNGWAIGAGEEYEDREHQDRVDAMKLYDLLEEEVIPTFFDRGPAGLPQRWIAMMKNSMAKISGRFNSHRMIEEYMHEYYLQAGQAHQILGQSRYARAGELSRWKDRVRDLWHGVEVVNISELRSQRISLGDQLHVTATIRLGELQDHEVVVDLCHGTIDRDGDHISDRNVTCMTSTGNDSNGLWHFEGTIQCDETGVYGYTIRILPFHPYLINPFSMSLVKWA